LNWLARRLLTICKKSWQRASNSIVDKERCMKEQIFFSNYFMLVAFISPVMFSKIVFAVWNFVRSLKLYYKKNFCQSLLLKSLEIRLFYCKLNSWKRGNSLSVLHINSPKYSNDQRGKLDWNWLKFYGERNTELRAIRAPSYKLNNQANSHNFKTLNWIYSQWLSLPFLRLFPSIALRIPTAHNFTSD